MNPSVVHWQPVTQGAPSSNMLSPLVFFKAFDMVDVLHPLHSPALRSGAGGGSPSHAYEGLKKTRG
ncbi:MAG: hypothetical protein JRI35_02530 [Deltaproteobacteria bacterium]|nr:hypothetical protein [Deltaproteobacteria bacterium]MBW1947550.1 hypothetical protein [Deltaproteobacteria bacterium]